MQRLQAGLQLGERYLLLERIAAGGMGEVWRVRDEVLQREVAAKVMSPRLDDEAKFAARFRSEARYAAGLSHPNIATIFDYGEWGGLAFLIMEYVDGTSLANLVKAQGALPPAQVRSIVIQTALALAAAHDTRVIHRDIKPANILLTPTGQVKLTDFGIARALDAIGHTRTGEMMGTPHYVSPEQARGGSAQESSDLYALGLVAYELLTGKRPFDREVPVAVLLAQINDPAPPLPESVPEDLRLVIECCLAKEPAKRPPGGRAIAAALGVREASTQWSASMEAVRSAGRLGDPDAASGSITPVTPLTPMMLLVGTTTGSAVESWVAPKAQSYDLEELLANLDPRLNPGEYAVVSVTDPPEGLHPYMSILEPEGITMLLSVAEATGFALEFELPLAWITLGAYRAIATQGYVPTVTTALAQARIPSVAGVGRWHTHLFVPAGMAEQAMKVLTRLSRAHRDD